MTEQKIHKEFLNELNDLIAKYQKILPSGFLITDLECAKWLIIFKTHKEG